MSAGGVITRTSPEGPAQAQSLPASAGPTPMQGAALALTALALALGTFMQVLDSTIANVSLPTIAGNLGVSTDQGTWVSPASLWPMASACR
jgi:DHA2 family multidrug resistance protein